MDPLPDTAGTSAPAPPAPPWRRRLTGPATVALVLAGFWGLMQASLWRKSPTFDELGGPTAGYTYWRCNDYRLDPEAGNLPQRVMALPLLSDRFRFPALSGEHWRTADVWSLAFDWFYNLGNDADAMMRRARAASGLMAVALGALVWFWSRRLFGPWGGLLSLLLFVLNPSILANGALATTDTAVSLFFLAAVGALWALLHRLTTGRLFLSAVVTAALFVTKMSAPLLVPMALALVAARLLSGRPLPVAVGPWRGTMVRRGPQAAAFAGAAAVHVLVAAAVIWASFGFRFNAVAGADAAHGQLFRRWEVLLGKPDPLTLLGDLDLSDGQKAAVNQMTSDFEMAVSRWTPERLAALATIRQKILTPAQNRALDEKMAAPPPTLIAQIIDSLRRHRVLPEAYLYGQCSVLRFSNLRNAFLNGEVSLTGWRWFFPYTLLVKTPLPVFGVLALAVAAAAVRRKRTAEPATGSALYETLPLWILLGSYWSVAVMGHLNIGHRHLLPTFPPMFVLAGVAAYWLDGWLGAGRADRSAAGTTAGRVAGVTLGGLIAALALAMAWCFPNYLAYFNSLAGGPAHAYRHLVDSSLDWGQDLPGVQRYLERHKVTGPVYLSYFGIGSPNYYLSPAHHVRYLYSFLGQDFQSPLVAVDLPIDRAAAQLAELLRQLPDYTETAEARLGDNLVKIVLLKKAAALRLTAGTYFISASMLQPVMYQVQGPLGPWNARYEEGYQRICASVKPLLLTDDPQVRLATLQQHPLSEWELTLTYFEMCRLARLTAYLRQREPDDNVNYSILVFRLTEADLARALEGPPPELGRDIVRETLQ
jgi:hypothetical protein